MIVLDLASVTEPIRYGSHVAQCVTIPLVCIYIEYQ